MATKTETSDKLIDEAITAFEGKEEATSQTLSFILPYLYVLTSLLVEDASLATTPLLDQRLVYDALRQIIQGKAEKNTKSLVSLVERIRIEESGKADYLVVTSLNVGSLPDDFASSFPRGTEISLEPFQSIASRFPGINEQLKEDLQNRGRLDELTAFKEYSTRPLWILIPAPHSERYRALDSAFARFDLFRAILNYTLSYGKATWANQYKPLCSVGSPWFSFLLEPHKIMSLSSNPDSHFVSASPTVKEWERILGAVRGFDKLRESPLKEAIRKAFILYGLALDFAEPNSTYYLLWSVAELLVGDKGRIENRLKGMYDSKSLDRRFIVDILHRKRNDLAHRGKLGVQMDDVNRLKQLIEELLQFAINMTDNVSTTEALSLCLDYACNTDEMHLAEEAIRAIKAAEPPKIAGLSTGDSKE